MYCSKCGAKQDDSSRFCTECGAALAAAPVAASVPPAPSAVPPAPASMPVQSAPSAVPPAPAAAPYAPPAPYGAPYAQAVPIAAPVQQRSLSWQWQTNVGYTIGGIALSLVVNSVLSVLEQQSETFVIIVAAFLLTLAYSTASAVWAIWAFPSLFTEKPRSTDSSAVSFANGFFGGVLFGVLWNTCLTKGKRGVSCYVAFGLYAVGILMWLALLVAYFTII